MAAKADVRGPFASIANRSEVAIPQIMENLAFMVGLCGEMSAVEDAEEAGVDGKGRSRFGGEMRAMTD